MEQKRNSANAANKIFVGGHKFVAGTFTGSFRPGSKHSFLCRAMKNDMTYLPNYASPAALIGDPVRALMLHALMDGRALPAGELAFASGVTPQTASSHLQKLVGGGLVLVEAEGRHRYFRLAGSHVAE